MYIIAVDTSNNICTVALNKNNENIDLLVENTPSKQAEKLLSMIEEIMERNNLIYNDISLFSTSIGPGSFTGVRIGISAIKGIELTTNKETSGVSNLQALAWRGSNGSNKLEIISCMNAMRNQLFVQAFKMESNIPIANSKAELIFIDDLKDYLGNHDGNNKYISLNCRELIPLDIIENHECSSDIITNAKDIANLSSILHSSNIGTKVSPLYIRPPDAKKANAKK